MSGRDQAKSPKEFNQDLTHENKEDDFSVHDQFDHQRRRETMQSNERTRTPHQPNDDILIMVHECQDKNRSRIKIAECTGNTTPERGARSKVWSVDQFGAGYHSHGSGFTQIGAQGYGISLPKKPTPSNAKAMDRMDTVKDAFMETSRHPSTMCNYAGDDMKEMKINKINGRIKIRNDSKLSNDIDGRSNRSPSNREGSCLDQFNNTVRLCQRKDKLRPREEVLYYYEKQETPNHKTINPSSLFRYNTQVSKNVRCSKTSQKLNRPAVAQKFAEFKALHNLHESLRQHHDFAGAVDYKQARLLSKLQKGPAPGPKEQLLHASFAHRGWKQQYNDARNLETRGKSELMTLQVPMLIKPITPPQQLPEFGIRFRGSTRGKTESKMSALERAQRHKSKVSSYNQSLKRTVENVAEFKSSNTSSVTNKKKFSMLRAGLDMEMIVSEYQDCLQEVEQTQTQGYEGTQGTPNAGRLGTAGNFPPNRQKIGTNPPRNCQTSHAHQQAAPQKLTGTEPITQEDGNYQGINHEADANYSSLGPFSGRNIKSQPNNPDQGSAGVRNSFVTFEETGNTTYVKQDTTSSNRYSKKKPGMQELDIEKIKGDNIYVSPATQSNQDSRRSLDATPIQLRSTFDNPQPATFKPKPNTLKLPKERLNQEQLFILNTVFNHFLKFHDRAHQNALDSEQPQITFTMFKKYVLSKYENDSAKIFAKVVIEAISVLLKNQKYDSFSAQVPNFNDLQVQSMVQKLLQRKNQNMLSERLTKVGEHCITEALDEDTLGLTPPIRSSRDHTVTQASPVALRSNKEQDEQFGAEVRIYHRPNLFDQSFDVLGSNATTHHRGHKYVSFQRSQAVNPAILERNPASSNSIIGSLKNCDSFLDFVHTQNNSQYDSGGITSMKSKQRYKLQGWEVEGKVNNLPTKFQAYTVLTKPKGQVPALNLNKQIVNLAKSEQAEKELQKAQKLMPNGHAKRQTIALLKNKVRKYCPDSKLLTETTKRTRNSKVKRSGHWTSIVNEQNSQMYESIMQSTARGDMKENSIALNTSLEVKATGFSHHIPQAKETNTYSESHKLPSTVDENIPDSRQMHEHKMVYKLDPNCIQEEATQDIQEVEETQKLLNLDLNKINNNASPIYEQFNRIDLETVRLLQRRKDGGSPDRRYAYGSRSQTPSKSRSNLKSIEHSYAAGGEQDLLADTGTKYGNKLVFTNNDVKDVGSREVCEQNSFINPQIIAVAAKKKTQNNYRHTRMSAGERMNQDYAIPRESKPQKKRSVLMRSSKASRKGSSAVSQTREVLQSQQSNTNKDFGNGLTMAEGSPKGMSRDITKSDYKPEKMAAELGQFEAIVVDSLSPASKSRMERDLDGLGQPTGGRMLVNATFDGRAPQPAEHHKAATEANTQRDYMDVDQPRKVLAENESYANIQINQIALKEDLLKFSGREDNYVSNDPIRETMKMQNHDSLVKTQQSGREDNYHESPNSRKVTSMLRKSWDSQQPNMLDDNCQTFRQSYKKGANTIKKGLNGINTDLEEVIDRAPKLRSSQQWSTLSKYRNSPSPKNEGDDAVKKKEEVNPIYILNKAPELMLQTEHLAKLQHLLSPISPSNRQFLFNLAGQGFNRRGKTMRSEASPGLPQHTAVDLLRQNQLHYLNNINVMANTIQPSLASDINYMPQTNYNNLNPIINFNSQYSNTKDKRMKEAYATNLDQSIMELRKMQKENAKNSILALQQNRQMQKMGSYDKGPGGQASRTMRARCHATAKPSPRSADMSLEPQALTPLSTEYSFVPFAAQSINEQLKFMDNLKKLRNKILEQSQLESIRLKNVTNLQLNRGGKLFA